MQLLPAIFHDVPYPPDLRPDSFWLIAYILRDNAKNYNKNLQTIKNYNKK